MLQIGYSLSGEEHAPNDLVRHAQRAEQAGFQFAMVSDHYHPWIDRQGQSPFVWGVIGAIAHTTRRLCLGTGVTCPIMRIHPAIIAQAAATAAMMMPGRFSLGLGSGENLNEHIFGHRWPPVATRLEMLEEAVEVIRLLWRGGMQSHQGRYFVVEYARIYSLPDHLPPILIAAGGERAAETAGRIGDGLVSVAPNAKLVEMFENAGGAGKPRYGQVAVCWAKTEAEARRTAREWWPNTALPGALLTQLMLPGHFEEATSLVTEEMIEQKIICGPDPERHMTAINKYIAAGYDHVYIHQVGPDQEGFFQFYSREVLPNLRETGYVRNVASVL